MAKTNGPDEPTRSTSAPDPPRQLLAGDDLIDAILNEIDDVLEENAEEFVRTYVQKGGNGGGEVVAFIHAWIEAIGPQRAADLFELLTALRHESDWPYRLLGLRYGSATARYWISISATLTEAIAFVASQYLEAEQRGALGVGNSADVRTERQQRLMYEYDIRNAERNGAFYEAREWLTRLSAAGDDSAAILLDEYKYLSSADPRELSNPQSETWQLLQLHALIKSALAPIADSPGRGRARARIQDLTVDLRRTGAEGILRPRGTRKPSITPQRKGATLEEATFTLLRQLFDLTSEDAKIIALTLRRQKAGFQGGHDIAFSFDWPVATNDRIHCHVECKNYRSTAPITTDNIAGKLLQSERAARGAPIDHWILVSPHADPANDLAQNLREWEQERRWDFNVQIWSPSTGIRELFAIAPKAYRAIYEDEPPDIDAARVLANFLSRLAPRQRIASSFVKYLQEDWPMCFPAEEVDHFVSLLTEHAELNTIDVAGRPVGRSLATVVETWLQSEQPATMLLLGEFGDGKSFFTYMLCRQLAKEFLRNPHEARFPVRLALRDLGESGSADDLIRKWLDRIGAKTSEWSRLTATYPTLIVLDGFDEMTLELDPPTIAHNRDLLALAIGRIAGPSTSQNRLRKVLVTSRGRFFDQPREEAALRERLADPAIVRIRPLSRTEVLAHLSRYARTIKAEDRLAKIKLMYDPIGLAAKPLFLQMIKATLHNLPEGNFGASTLYESYIEQSLRTKWELLIGSPSDLREEIIDGMRHILEEVAVRLHNTNSEQVNLRDLEDTDRHIANILWRMTSHIRGAPLSGLTDNREEDARMRVSIRSLLRPIPSTDSSEWPVNFFHRSMAEFFLASAIARALEEHDVGRIRVILGHRAISSETASFVIEKLKALGSDRLLAPRLESLARSALRDLGTDEALGGNALTLLFRLEGKLRKRDWSGLRLDNVNLTGANLQDFDFSNSSLCYANLDNADLRRANLTDADLTGLRVEQTTLVETVAVERDSGLIFAAYSDGTIREWRSSGTDHWTARTVFTGLEGSVRNLIIVTSALIIAVASAEAWILARTEPEWIVSSRTPVSPYLRDFSLVEDEVLSSLQVGKGVERCEVNINTGSQEMIISGIDGRLDDALSAVAEGVADRSCLIKGRWALTNIGASTSISSELLNLETGGRYVIPCELPISSFDVVRISYGRFAVYVGSLDGQLYRGLTERGIRYRDLGSGMIHLELFSSERHDGPITTVDAVEDGLVVTGGRDRCLRIWRRTGLQARVQRLFLTLRCAHAILDGVEGPAEHTLLSELAMADIEESF